MKTIEEIMGLVEKYGWAVVALNDAKSNSDIAKELAKVNESSAAIESALRELVWRKPLSDADMWDLLGHVDSDNRMAAGRAVESHYLQAWNEGKVE